MSKFCGKCGTENRDDYIFCKKCGTPLSYGRKTENTYTAEEMPYNGYEGVNTSDMVVAIGANYEKIDRKFTNMKLADSKISWCWPVALLSYFFGLLGSAIWFFYRKMYKAAIICLALGIALSVGKYFLIKEPLIEYVSAISDKVQSEITSEFSGEEGFAAADLYDDFFKIYSEDIEKYSQTDNMRFYSFLNTAEKYISTLVLGMFAMYIYRSHLIKTVKNLKQKYPDNSDYKNELVKKTGTSGAMVAVGIVIGLIASNIASLLPVILYFKK